MANVPSIVSKLVETFDRNLDAYRSQQYNETQLRREFIDPLFEELGWDVTNKAGYAEAYKDVIHEDAIKVGTATKAPDYCFRIGGVRKFFLEAKKPSIDLKGDPHPAYQLRRYAWSAKLPLSILTDFEEFAIYDCQTRPKQTDGASTARIMYLTYKDYLNKWDKIAEIFSKDAVLKGSFDKFAVSPKGRRGTTTVDKEFLAEIEKWRDMLAKIIALRNRTLSTRELNFSVQRTIDRILFLRMCEDRGIENYGQLLKISSGDRAYPRLCEIFEKADQKYNSGLFHFTDEPGRPELPDELTLNLIIDDKDLKWILYSLYYPQSPYEFSVLPPEILGNVYEQFLGKVIYVSPARRVKIEEKPEVKKTGGIYYTPSYIVDYIVKNTVSKLIEGKTPKQIEKAKILDPACGSGSFLLGAYTHLLDYHRDWYSQNDPETWAKKKNPPIYQTNSASRHREEQTDKAIPNYRLTISEKKRILLNNIFGVDIDSQAVEVTKLSLLLKVLEGENQQTLENQYRLFHERALPDLGNNIKCGNSLISPDFFDNLDPESVTDDLRQKINPFDWQAEFPQIFARKNPGFDTVIGNPPYVRPHRIDSDVKNILWKYYRPVFQAKSDLYACFMQRALDLLRRGGYMSFIVSRTWLSLESFAALRQYILGKSKVRLLALPPRRVFQKATVETLIVVLERETKEELIQKNIIQILGFSQNHFELEKQIPQKLYQKTHLNVFDLSLDQSMLKLQKKLQAANTSDLKKCIRFFYGLKTADDSRFLSTNKSTPEHKKLLRRSDFIRYATKWCGEYVWYVPHVMKKHRKTARPGEPERFESPKIMVLDIAKRIVATLDEEGYYVKDALLFLKDPTGPALKYILGLLNSQLLNYYYASTFKTLSVAKNAILTLPIRTIDFDNPEDVAKHDKMVKLVERMLDLHKKFAVAKIPDEKTKIQRQITAVDNQIDQLVYGLYGLTDEEIKIVEGSNQK